MQTEKWEQRAIDYTEQMLVCKVDISFTQAVEIDGHAFGNVTIHVNGGSRLFGEILATDLKVALFYGSRLERFNRRKIEREFTPFTHK